MSTINPMPPHDAYFWAHRKEAVTMGQWLKRNGEQRSAQAGERQA